MKKVELNPWVSTLTNQVFEEKKISGVGSGVEIPTFIPPFGRRKSGWWSAGGGEITQFIKKIFGSFIDIFF